MNETLLMEDLTELNNSLQHSGRPGMKWGVFGASGATRWQPGAVYAKGMSAPGSSGKKSLFGKKDKEKKDKEKKEKQIKSKKSDRSLAKYSDDELRKMTERLRLENNYRMAVQDTIRDEISAKRLAKEYKEVMSNPKKKGKSLKAFENILNRSQNALLDVTIETGKKYATAKIKQNLEKKDPDLYKKMYG